jgi:hypothetical protein
LQLLNGAKPLPDMFVPAIFLICGLLQDAVGAHAAGWLDVAQEIVCLISERSGDAQDIRRQVAGPFG